jgi:hypothetical protein
MENDLLQKLLNKTLTKEGLLQKVKEDYTLLPLIIDGTTSSKATIRYGCAKVLTDLSKENPDELYPYMEDLIYLLESKYRILIWNAMAIIANLTKVDEERKFDKIFEKYYNFIDDEYMVTVANVVGHSGNIALAKPYLIDKITNELLKVENLSTTPHITEECKRVISEKAIKSFDLFYDKIEKKGKVISFVKKQVNSPRITLKKTAQNFLDKWT